MKKEGMPQKGERESIPYVNIKSDPELVERRINELLPLMQMRDKYRSAIGDLKHSRRSDVEADFGWAGSARLKQVEGVKELNKEVEELKTLGVSYEEIRKYSPILDEIGRRMQERLEDIEGKIYGFVQQTDYTLGRHLDTAVQLLKLKEFVEPGVYKQIVEALNGR